MLLSLRKYLEASDMAAPETVRVAELFLQGIQIQACQMDDLEYARFRSDLSKLLTSISAKPANGDVILATGAAIQAMSAYNQQIGRTIRSQMAELQTIIKMLGETLRTLLGGSERQLDRLQNIETQIQRASQVDDLRTLKTRLEDCLGDLRVAMVNERENAAKVDNAIQTEIEKGLAATAPPAGVLDPCTGLPGPTAAEAELKKAVAERSTCFAAIFSVNRVEAINQRFGYPAGDRILTVFSQHIAGKLPKTDMLFRWRGPAFLAVMHRSSPADAIRAEVARIASARVEETIEVGTRTIMLPISANSVVVAVHECRLFDDVLQKLRALPSVSM